MNQTHYLAGTKWLPEHVNILLEEYQRGSNGYIKRSSQRLRRPYSAIVAFIGRRGGIQQLFSKGIGHVD